MYLTKLYQYNKWLFAAIVFFILMQLLVTYKRGMVISPWYNYGMYSEKMYPQKVYAVNNKLNRGAWFYLVSPQHDDKINVTLDNYRKIAQNDSLYRNEIVRLFAKFHLLEPKESYYRSELSKNNFNTWFAGYCNTLNHSAIVDTHAINQSQYAIWDGKKFQLP